MKQKMFVFFIIAIVALFGAFLLLDKAERLPVPEPTATIIKPGDRYAANAYSWEGGPTVSCIVVQGAPLTVVSVEETTVRITYDGHRDQEPFCKLGDPLEISKQKILNSTKIL